MRRIAQLAVSSLFVASAAAAAPAAAGAAGCSGADSIGPKSTHATLCLLNQQRRAHGLRRLRLDGKLGRAARRHATDMVTKHYFAHDSRSGASFSARIKRTGWTRSRRSYLIGENIGWGDGDFATPRAMVDAWMHSAGHRANILARQFRLIGIGVALGAPSGGAGATYATDFGG